MRSKSGHATTLIWYLRDAADVAECANEAQQVGRAQRGRSGIVQRGEVHPLALEHLLAKDHIDAALCVVDQCERRHRPGRQCQHFLQHLGPSEREAGCAQDFLEPCQISALWVESRCGAVAVGRTYLLPPLSFGGASLVWPWLRLHTPLIEPDMQISRIRLSDKTSRLHPRRVVPKSAQAYEPEVSVEVREWIAPAPASPDLVLRPTAQPRSCRARDTPC